MVKIFRPDLLNDQYLQINDSTIAIAYQGLKFSSTDAKEVLGIELRRIDSGVQIRIYTESQFNRIFVQIKDNDPLSLPIMFSSISETLTIAFNQEQFNHYFQPGLTISIKIRWDP